MIEFVTASHKESVLQANLMQSDIIHKYRLHVLAGFDNVAHAYNSATLKGNIIVYVHHDVYLPPDFENNLFLAFAQLNDIDPEWGVLGVAGVQLVNGRKEIFGHINDRGKEWGKPNDRPMLVETLDEMLLITRGDFKFDENLPQDFYGADICWQAIIQGKNNYAIPAYCFHNSARILGGRTESFYKSIEYFKNKWKDHLPIATTCTIINKENVNA